jgi:hypothetical protein
VQLEITEARLKREMDQRQQELEKEEGARKRRNLRAQVQAANDYALSATTLQAAVKRMLAIGAYISMQAAKAAAAYAAAARCLQGATRRLLAACMARARAGATVALQATLRRLLARQAYTVAYQEYLQTEGPMKAAREAEAARLLAETKEKRERMMRDESSYTVDRSQILDQLRSRRTSTVVQVSGA